MSEEKQKLFVAFPPRFVFKGGRPRKQGGNVIDGTRTNPTFNVVSPSQANFVFTHMEYPGILSKCCGVRAKYIGGDQLICKKCDKPCELDFQENKNESGQLGYFEKCPFPQKGHPFPQAVHSITGPKRMLIRLFQVVAGKDFIPFLAVVFLMGKKRRARILNKILFAYNDAAKSTMYPFFLEEDRYSIFCRELRKLIARFLKYMGVDESVAEDFAEIFATLIEYDNAYRLRFEDTFSESSKEKILANPGKELSHMLMILSMRGELRGMTKAEIESIAFVPGKFKKIVLGMKMLFLVPSIKKAFKFAVSESNFQNFQLDDADRYHVLLWSDHNFLGLPIEKRLEMWDNYHKEHPPLPPRVIISPQ